MQLEDLKAEYDKLQISDVMIAKNYLDEKQIKKLERAVSGYFDYIEEKEKNI